MAPRIFPPDILRFFTIYGNYSKLPTHADLQQVTVRLKTSRNVQLCLLVGLALTLCRLVLVSVSVVSCVHSSNSTSTVTLPRTMMRPVADRLEAAPEKGLQPIEPFVLEKAHVLEHLVYHFGSALGGMRSLIAKHPLVYFVTPTYYRSTQMADMTRLSQTLMHDKRVYWIVLEDRDNCTVRIRALLERTGLPFAHLAVPTDPAIKAQKRVKGVEQRNRALDIVEQIRLPGVVYFGDDDNSYDST